MRTSMFGGAPRFDATDQLWFDGLELLPCAEASLSASCRAGGTHTTRIETYTRIRLDQTSNTWMAWKPNGTRIVLSPRKGNTSSPETTLRWLLTEVSDTHGNRVLYDWICGTTNACYIGDISYGEGKTCSATPPTCPDSPAMPVGSPMPGANIHFYWEGRPDPPSVAMGGTLEETTWRLRAIEVTEGGRSVRAYQVNYLPELSGAFGYRRFRSSIASIQEFGSDVRLDTGGNVLSGTAAPAQRFEAPFHLYAPLPSLLTTLASNGQFRPPTQARSTLPPIYNKDYLAPSGGATPRWFLQRLPESKVIVRTYRTDLPFALQKSDQLSVTLGDFDGDRKLDVLHWGTNATCNQITTRTLMAVGGSRPDETQAVPQANLCATMSLPADLDADGRSDVVYLRYRRINPFSSTDVRYEAEIMSARSNGDASFTYSAPKQLWTSPSESVVLQSQCGVGDVNGDRRADLACTIKDGGLWVVVVAISDGYGRFDVVRVNGTNTLTDRHTLVLSDANADGLSDLLVLDESRVGTATQLDAKVGTSAGDGSFVWSTQPSNFASAGPNQRSRVLVGDLNADSRADLVLVISKDDGSGGSITTFTSKGDTTRQFLTWRTDVTGLMPAVSVADANGDGMDDLAFAVREKAGECRSTLNYDHVALNTSLSNGSGTFPIPQRLDGCYSPSLNWPWVGDITHDPMMTYVNGDQIADLFQYADVLLDVGPKEGPPVYKRGFILLDRSGEYRRADMTRWRETDVNGDGRSDWIYLNYANPGVTVLTQITQPDRTRRVVRQDVPSSGSGRSADLARPDAVSTWFLVDIGGGTADAPDGKADVVLIDDVSQRIVTLLSNGDGTWKKKVHPYDFSLISELRGHPSAAPFGDISNWRAIDVNGDGMSDLVHIAFRQATGAQSEIHVTTVPALGRGRWGPAIPGNYRFNGNLRSPSVLGFFPADVDGDGRMDLVQVLAESFLPLGQNAVVWTLLSRANGSWDDRYQGVTLPSQATANWQPMDVNGDGRTDLVSFRSKLGQPLLVSYMLSLGDGRWQSVQNAQVSPQPIVDTFASQEFRIYDLDGDGKQDIIHLSKVSSGQLATMVIWNRFPNFVQTTTTGLAFTGGDTTSWQLVDLGADGTPELVRMQQTGGTEDLDVISIPAWSVRMSRTSNDLGASEEIYYETVVEAKRDMPLGALPHVVKSVGVRSADGGAYIAVTQFSYTGATWSYRQQYMLGFRHVERSDGTRILSSDLELSDDCGARPLTEELLDSQRRLISHTQNVFAPTGSTPNPTASGDTHNHSLCRIDTVFHEEWERAATPRKSTDHLTYDDYGNVSELEQGGDPANPDDDRRFKTTVNFNVGDFIVDRPAEQEVYGRSGGQWNLLSRTRYEYDGSNDYTRPPGSLGDLSRVRRWNDKTATYIDVTYEYDGRGNLYTVTGPPIPSNPAGVTYTFEYDCEFARFLVKTCDPLNCSEVVWNELLGLPRMTLDANRGRTTFDYDPLGRPLKVVQPDGSFDAWRWPTPAQWNTSAQAVRHERSDDSPRDGVLWDETFFDGLGRTIRVEYEGGVVEEVMAYDGVSARVQEESAPRFAPDAREVTTYDYDAAGRLLSMRRPDGSTRKVRYDVGVSTVTDELGATTGYEIDPFGRIVAVRENRRDCFAETCPIVETGITRYAYDALDRLTLITDARSNKTRYSWDSLGRLEDTCDPDRGCTYFTWNDDGTQETEIGVNKTLLRMTYDTAGRLAARESFDSTGTMTRQVRWTWDIDPALGGSRGASLGRITRVEDISGAARLLSTYHYDPLGRVDLESTCIDGACFELGTQFDHAGRISRITYPSANGRLAPSSPTVDYVYDDRGLLHSLPGFVDEFMHDARGQTTEITYMNGIVESRPYDPKRGWSEGVTVQGSSSPLLEQVVLRDLVGRVRDERLVDSQGARHEVYTHDDLGRLTVVTSSDPARNRTFTYDILGNLTYHSLLGTVKYGDSRHVHAMTHTQSGERYRYDLGGQLLSSNQLKLAWSDEGRPARITNRATGEESIYAYDVSGQRVRAEISGKVTLYPNRFVQIDPGGALMYWVWAEGRPLAYVEGSGPHFLHADALGSVRLVTDGSGRVENEYDYGAWGEATRATGPGGSAYRYAESRRDDSTALAYMNARYHDPTSTRFISADPIIPDVYAPQSLNRYAYALNDPVTRNDPSGHCVENPDKQYETTVCDRRYQETVERQWHLEQRAAQREEFRQSRELGGGPIVERVGRDEYIRPLGRGYGKPLVVLSVCPSCHYKRTTKPGDVVYEVTREQHQQLARAFGIIMGTISRSKVGGALAEKYVMSKNWVGADPADVSASSVDTGYKELIYLLYLSYQQGEISGGEFEGFLEEGLTSMKNVFADWLLDNEIKPGEAYGFEPLTEADSAARSTFLKQQSDNPLYKDLQDMMGSLIDSLWRVRHGYPIRSPFP